MTCDEIRDHLDHYLAGRLDAVRRAEVDDHVAQCGDCRADVEASRFVAPLTAHLRREIAPSNDLWTGIAPRLRPATRRLSVSVGWLVAAAILLVAGSSVATFALFRKPSAPVGAAFATIEARYQEAALALNGLYQKSRDSLAPETKAVLERNLAVIERALGEAREALRSDPTNQTLEAIVVSAYQRKLAFLERATALDWKS